MKSQLKARWRLSTAAATSAACAMAVMFGVLPVRASPYPVTPGTDPRDPANCPGGVGTDGSGNVTWCRVNGLTVTTTSGAGARWAGQYAFLYDFGGGAGQEVVFGWCLHDDSSQPRVTYPAGAAVPGEDLAVALNGPLAHPELKDVIVAAMAASADATVDTAVPGRPTVYTDDEWAAAIWALQHLVVGDTSSSGTVVVSSMDAFVGEVRTETLMQELVAYAAEVRNAALDVRFVQANVTPAMTATVAQAGDGGPFRDEIVGAATVSSVTNLRWADGSAITVGEPIDNVSNPNISYVSGTGTYTLNLAPIDVTMSVAIGVQREWQAVNSWLGFPVPTGQQSTGAYFRGNNGLLADSATAAPLPPNANPTISSVAGDAGDGDQVVIEGGTVSDDVTLGDLTVGMMYTLQGVLYDKTTSTLTPAVSADVTFTARTASSSRIVTLQVPAGTAGHDLVVFLNLFDGPSSSGPRVASASDPDDLAETVRVSPALGLSTNAGADIRIGAGTPLDLSDSIMLSGLTSAFRSTAAEGATGTARVYGPFASLAAASCTASTQVGSAVTVDWSMDGTVMSPPVTIAAPSTGFYTWVAEVTTSQGRSVTHACGVPNETPALQIQDELMLSTDAGGDVMVPAGSSIELTDRVTLTGLTPAIGSLDAETATGTVALFGPFASLAAASCTAATQVAAPRGVAWAADGTVTSSPVTIAAPSTGFYSWVASVSTSHGRSATHRCGLAAETPKVFVPQIRTTARVTDGTVFDGTVFVPGHSALYDVVSWADLAPGTYDATVVWQSVNVTDGTERCSPTALTTTVSFVVAAGVTSGSVLVGPVPVGALATPATPATPFVAFERVTPTGAGSLVLASHEECNSATQRVSPGVPWIATTVTATNPVEGPVPAGAQTVGMAGGRIGDTITFANFPPGTYTTTADWQIKSNDGTCTPSGFVTTGTWTVAPGSGHGVATVPPQTSPLRLAGRTLVAFETVTDAGGTAIAEHKNCGSVSQTVLIGSPSITTRVQQPVLKPGDQFVDIATVTGVAPGVPSTIVLHIFRHIPGTLLVCAETSLVATLSYAISGSGDFPSPPYAIPEGEVDGVEYIAVESLHDPADGAVLATHECGVPSEIATVFKPRQPFHKLPVTGASPALIGAVGALLVLAGSLIWFRIRRPAVQASAKNR